MKCEADLAALQGAVRRVVADIMAGPSSPGAARALLPHLPLLAALLGPR